MRNIKEDLKNSIKKLKLIEKLESMRHGEVKIEKNKPYIFIGTINSQCENESEDIIKSVREHTNKLTEGTIGGISSYEGSSDWAIITCPLNNTEEGHIERMTTALKKYFPNLIVSQTITTKKVYK